jgi:uncharacterized protein
MEPTFFGDKERPLYGIYQPPLSNSPRETAVLFCYPVFQEYIRSHRSFCQLAMQLAKAGCHVFRFDYSSTGDSSGHLNDADISQWKTDIVLAANELRDLSGVKNISIVGLRMGATLAAISGLKNIKDLVLWDPVAKGETYLRSLETMHKHMLTDSDRFPVPREDEMIDGVIELLGFSLSEKLFNSIRAIDLTMTATISSKNIHLIVSSESAEIQKIEQSLSSGANNIHYQCISSTGNWDDLSCIEETLIPHDILNRISELLT